VQFNCVKTYTKNWTECYLAQHRFPIRFVGFFVISVCLLVRVTMVDKNKAVVCCLLATSAIMLPEKQKRKRKVWSKKWYLKRNMSCVAHLLNGVPWDDAMVVAAGKLRKLWDSLSELCSSLCERRLGRTVLRSALLPLKTVQFTQLFSQVWHHNKMAQYSARNVKNRMRRYYRCAFYRVAEQGKGPATQNAVCRSGLRSLSAAECYILSRLF